MEAQTDSIGSSAISQIAFPVSLPVLLSQIVPIMLFKHYALSVGLQHLLLVVEMSVWEVDSKLLL